MTCHRFRLLPWWCQWFSTNRLVTSSTEDRDIQDHPWPRLFNHHHCLTLTPSVDMFNFKHQRLLKYFNYKRKTREEGALFKTLLWIDHLHGISIISVHIYCIGPTVCIQYLFMCNLDSFISVSLFVSCSSWRLYMNWWCFVLSRWLLYTCSNWQDFFFFFIQLSWMDIECLILYI